MREFQLSEHKSGAYELLPNGWSFGALALHMFWAISDGVFLRFAKFFLPPVVVMAIGIFLLDIEEYEFVAIVGIVLSNLFLTGFTFFRPSHLVGERSSWPIMAANTLQL